MITMKGKYNIANIMIDNIDEATKKQIQGFLNHPAFANTYIAIQADTHFGKGAVVGFTMKMNDYIIPNIIGCDISCGMLATKFDITEINVQKLDEFIKRNIPSGFHINSTYNGDMYLKYQVKEVCKQINIDSEKALRAAGSLGSGNHYIEAGKGYDGKIWITIHSGSRNFGLQIANYYQKKAKENLEKCFIRDQYKDLEFLLADSQDGHDYMYAMLVAGGFAENNRVQMLYKIADFFNIIPTEMISSVHNFIGSDNIIRKGATSANLGEKLIIPFNMRDGMAICAGKGNAKYNFSAPHGAGRILSRKKAKETLSVDEFKAQMGNANIYTTTANADTLDEAPDAYKDMNLILENIKETVDVIEMVKPIYNYKANDKMPKKDYYRHD